MQVQVQNNPVGESQQVVLTGRSIISVQDLDRAEIELVLQEAQRYQQCLKTGHRFRTLGGYVLATLFFEPSTRTRLSFESAMHRLGGSVISTPDGRHRSSAVKGETIADTIRTVVSYADVIVQRHPVLGSAGEAAPAAPPSPIPGWKPGAGARQHPTHPPHPLYTIQHETGSPYLVSPSL